MLFGIEERKYYRFPSQASILDYEMDHDVYFPAKDAIHHNEQVPTRDQVNGNHYLKPTHNFYQ